jgi:hypothetical protein
MTVHRNLKNLADFQAMVDRHHAERDEYKGQAGLLSSASTIINCPEDLKGRNNQLDMVLSRFQGLVSGSFVYPGRCPGLICSSLSG